jgi:hypothetical protein
MSVTQTFHLPVLICKLTPVNALLVPKIKCSVRSAFPLLQVRAVEKDPDPMDSNDEN